MRGFFICFKAMLKMIFIISILNGFNYLM